MPEVGEITEEQADALSPIEPIPPIELTTSQVLALADQVRVAYKNGEDDQAFEDQIERRKPNIRTILRANRAGEIEEEESAEALALLAEEQRKGAMIDAVMELPTRLAGQEMAEQIIRLALANGEDLTVAMCDVDKFKLVNDEEGHAAGDKVLLAVARTLQNGVRASDLVAKWGGEEILVLFRGMNESDAAVRMNELRASLPQSVRDKSGLDREVTMTAGITQINMNNEDNERRSPERLLEDSLHVADERLYLGKNGGRNQVVDSAQAETIRHNIEQAQLAAASALAKPIGESESNG